MKISWAKKYEICITLTTENCQLHLINRKLCFSHAQYTERVHNGFHDELTEKSTSSAQKQSFPKTDPRERSKKS